MIIMNTQCNGTLAERIMGLSAHLRKNMDAIMAVKKAGSFDKLCQQTLRLEGTIDGLKEALKITSETTEQTVPRKDADELAEAIREFCQADGNPYEILGEALGKFCERHPAAAEEASSPSAVNDSSDPTAAPNVITLEEHP